MPRNNHVPKYSHHKASGQAYVKLRDGTGGYHFVYLGVHGSAESREAYRRTLAEYDAGSPPEQILEIGAGPTVAQVFLKFLKHAEVHYRRADGTQTPEVEEYKALSTLVNGLYSRTPAAKFGPKALKAVRQAMIGRGLCRKVINQRIGRLKNVFKFAVAEELVSVEVYHALLTVTGLQKGRSDIRESEPVTPVDDARVDATLPFLTRHVRGIVEFQRRTGCRPGEAAAVRRADIDFGGEIWLYKPPQHKGSWRGKERIITVGPLAQEVLREFFTTSINDYLFSPKRSMQEFRAAQRRNRKTPVQPSQRIRAKRAPAVLHLNHYTARAYAKAVLKGCDRAFPSPGELALRLEETTKEWKARLTPEQRAALQTWREASRWHPNQLRHTHGTKVRKQFGLEAAQVALGHSKADITELYAQRNLDLALKVAASLG